jgi:hypothetical protein
MGNLKNTISQPIKRKNPGFSQPPNPGFLNCFYKTLYGAIVIHFVTVVEQPVDVLVSVTLT